MYTYYRLFTRSINAREDLALALSLCLPSDNSTGNVDSGEMSWHIGLSCVLPA